MTTRIKAFLYGVNNIAMVNPYNLWFTGGDYDIDKVYSMGYTVKNGKVVGWSRYFNYSDERHLRLSMLLPHPNGETITYDENGIKLDFNDINNIREFNNAYVSKNQSNIDAVYKNFVHTMRKIQSNNIAVVDLAGNITDIPNDIKQFLDGYFTEDINKSLEEAGLFNTYIHELNSSARDIANQAHHQRAMDMGVVKDAGKNSAKGEASKEVTPMNPANIAEFKETNMIGKQVIGIVATGLKVYSALCTYYMNKLNKNDFNNMLFNNKVMLRIQDETGKVVDKDIMWNAIGTINFERLYGNLEALSNKLGEEGIDKDTFIQNMLLMDTYNESTSLVVSSLLSSATDNAKELILGKINSGPETAGMYMYALMMGNDFTRFSNLMVSKEADFFVSASKKNIFNEQTYNRNLDMFGKIGKKGKLNWVYDNYVNLKSLDLNSKKKLISRIHNAYNIYEDESKEIIPDLELSRILSEYAQGDINLDIEQIVKAKDTSNLKFVEAFDDNSSEESWDMIDPYSYDPVGDYGDYDEYESGAFDQEDYMVKFSRAFVELESLKKTIDSISLGKLNNLYNFYRKSKPLKDFGTILSINQGVKSDQAALLSHSNLIGKLIDSMMPTNEAREDIIDEFKVLDKKFDLKLFLMDDQYRQMAINDFDLIKYDINYLDVLANSPHFFEMLKADIATLDFEEQRSFKFRSIKNIAKSFTDGIYFPRSNDINKFVNSNQIDDISKYIDNAMIVKFLIDNNIEVVLPKGSTYIKNNDLNGYMKGTLTETTKINLSKPHGRATFIEWFENNVIRDLKKGKTLSFDEELIDDLNLENNSFIDGIKYDYNEDRLTKDMYQYIKPGISMMNIKSENDKVEFENQKLDFIKLGKVYYNGQNVLSLLYLYNLIVNRNKANSSSFTLMFEKSAEFMNPNISLYHQYSRYIADIDMNVDNVLSHNDFIGSNFYLSQEISDAVDPVAYQYRKVGGKQLSNGKYGYEFTLDNSPMTLPKGYVDKYIALTNIRQLSQVSIGEIKPTYRPDKETNKQLLNILCESIRNKLNIDINIDYNPDNIAKASVNLQDKKVYINAAYASVAEPMHELLHIALELINMKDHNLYTKIVTSVQTHPLYNDIALDYGELQGLDLDEEVFVTVFSNIFNNKVQSESSKKWSNVNDDVHDDLMKFTDEAFSDIFGKEIKDGLHKNLFDLFNESMLEGRFDTLFSESENILNEGLTNMQNKMIELGMNKECK